MAEYLTPGVYVEETSFRARTIEGVPTSTFGLVGLTAYGPVPYKLPQLIQPPPLPPAAAPLPPVVMVPQPTLVTSYTEYERAFGGLDQVGTLSDTTNYLAYAARAFFNNGGQRLYVSRVFSFTMTTGNAPAIDLTKNFAMLPLANGPTWRARWPGFAGNQIQVSAAWQRSKNVLIQTGAAGGPASASLTGVGPGAAVEIGNLTDSPISDLTPPNAANIKIVMRDPVTDQLGYAGANGVFQAVDPSKVAYHITLNVSVTMGTRNDVYSGMELNSAHPRAITRVMGAVNPTDEMCLVWLDTSVSSGQPLTDAAVLTALLTLVPTTQGGPGPGPQFLNGGTEGDPLGPDALQGLPADPDDATVAATGLEALGEIDDVAIVAAPDIVRLEDPASQMEATSYLITHCEQLRYRIAVVDPPVGCSISQVREFRGQFDTEYGALYYPWIRIIDPTAKPDPGAPPATLDLPPSGSTAGIYARSDIERGVFKAPANEVVQGVTQFVKNVTYAQQGVLNPEGINALRTFPDRGDRVWGARTMSSDPEWRYVNVRRLFIYLEHSIDKATQWVVFEPNNEALWASVKQSIEDFLLATWRTGALMGTKPEQAYFVRCDRTTMTQNDLDNGRLICLIGVAPTYPAEFVIFRIGQWTADAQQS
jgi:phage tail sheath protein FI